MSKNWVNSYFSEDELKDVQSAIDQVESKTVGEIVLSVRNKRSILEKLYTKHELAIKDFDTLGVANTRERTGILIFIIFEEKYYDVIADEGIYAKIHANTWNALERKLKKEFANKSYSAGILHIIEKAGEILEKEFPTRAGAVNDDEISGEIVIN